MKLDLKHLNKIFWLQVLFLIIIVAIYSGYLLLSGTISVEASETEINKILFKLFIVLLITIPLFVNVNYLYKYFKNGELNKAKSHILCEILIGVISYFIINN